MESKASALGRGQSRMESKASALGRPDKAKALYSSLRSRSQTLFGNAFLDAPRRAVEIFIRLSTSFVVLTQITYSLHQSLNTGEVNR